MNFALILFVLVVITGIAWVADKLVFAPKRRAAGIDRMPLWLEYTASFFPVIFSVFFLRSFLFEPFKIPSGSMIPSLMIGDFILVNKYTYGVRLPVLNKKIIEMNAPQRGDVAVFRYPMDESVDYIKRVIALPGDVISYQDKRLSLNGQPLAYETKPDFLDPESLSYVKFYRETFPKEFGGYSYLILNHAERPGNIFNPAIHQYSENCQYNISGVTCTVPPGHYFVMGDNRDNSADSRYWGFVPEANLVGKAFFVWMNLSDLKRIGRFE
jgi:signal peptidase I